MTTPLAVSTASRDPKQPALPHGDWPFNSSVHRLTEQQYADAVAAAPVRTLPAAGMTDTPKTAICWISGGIDLMAQLSDDMVRGIAKNHDDFSFTASQLPNQTRLITDDVSAWVRSSGSKRQVLFQLQDKSADIALVAQRLASATKPISISDTRALGMMMNSYVFAAKDALRLLTSESSVRQHPIT